MLDFAITQKNLAPACECIRIGRLSAGFKTSFQFSLHDPFRSAGLGDNLIGLHVAELDRGGKWRVFRLRFDCETAADVTAAGLRGNIRKIQLLRIITKGRLQVLQEEAIPERYFRDFCSATERDGTAQTRLKIDLFESRDHVTGPIEKPEIPARDTHPSNLGNKTGIRLFGFGLHPSGRSRRGRGCGERCCWRRFRVGDHAFRRRFRGTCNFLCPRSWTPFAASTW